MSNKISPVIATILLVMIIIALVGTAYIYMAGMIGGKIRIKIGPIEIYEEAEGDKLEDVKSILLSLVLTAGLIIILITIAFAITISESVELEN